MDPFQLYNSIFVYDPVAILKFDTFLEILVVGTNNGWIRVFGMKTLEMRASFRAHNTAVLNIICSNFGIFSLSNNTIALHTHNGLPVSGGVFANLAENLSKLEIVENNLKDKLDTPLEFTDICFDSSQFDQQQRAQRLIVSTNSNLLYVFDLNFVGMKSKDSTPHIFSTGDIGSIKGISCLKYAERKKYLLCGTMNGRLLVIDGVKMRKDSKTYSMMSQSGLVRILKQANVLREYNAFQNEVTSIGLQNEQVVMTGYSTRQIHKSAFQQQQDALLKATTGATIKSDYHADVQVQIFDLRRMTQCFPVQFTYQTAPVQVDFLPESNSKCCAMAKNGTLLILDATYDLSQAEVYQGNPSGTISTTFGVSSNGRILAIGDNVGAVHVWTNYNENEINLNPEDGIKATYYDQPLAELPQFYAPDPVCSIPPTQIVRGDGPMNVFDLNQDDGVPMKELGLGIYSYESSRNAINRPVFESGMPYSPSYLFSNLPKGFQQTLATIKKRALAVKPEVLAKANLVDGVAYIDINHLTTDNAPALTDISGSILYGKNQQYIMYEADLRHQGRGGGGGEDSVMGMYEDVGEDSLTYFSADGKQVQIPPESVRFTNGGWTGSKIGQGLVGGGLNFKSKTGKYNNTKYAGLENMLDNSYINPLIVCFYFLKPIRNSFIGHLSPLDPCLTDELGFAFHMLDAIYHEEILDKSISLLNFQTAFRRIPEAAALGLLEPSKLNVQRRIGHSTRFLMQHLMKEMQITEDKYKKINQRLNNNNNSNTNNSSNNNNNQFVSACKFGGNVLEKLFGMEFHNKDKSLSGYETDRYTTSMVVDLLSFNEAEKIIENKESNTNANTVSDNTDTDKVTVEDGKEEVESTDNTTVIPPVTYSFADSLHKSITNTVRVARAWCEGSRKYEPLKKFRRPRQLPPFLCINVVPSDDGGKDSKPNDNWLQGWREESIATQEDGNAKDDKRFLPQRFKIELSDSRLFNETTKSEESNGVEVIPIHNDESLEDTLKQSEGKSNLGTDKARIYELVSVISCVTDPLKKHKNKNQHLICHVKLEDESNNRKWMVFNDIKISTIDSNGGGQGNDEVATDVLNPLDFRPTWRTPCVLFFRCKDFNANVNEYNESPRINIPRSVFRSPSLTLKRQNQMQQQQHRRTFRSLDEGENLTRGDLVAIDCEFVSTGAEESKVDSNGRRVVMKPSKLSLARVSVTRANGIPFIDDYILKTEAVVDYLTRFSGIVPGDLDPNTSRHHLVTLKTSYLKLRNLVDQGVTFVGHGLKKDFNMINIHVPADQIIDTVHLFHLPGQRMIGLAFLVKHLLGAGIQDSSQGHDSIEDAHGALLLYKKYRELKMNGKLDEVLKKLYEIGHKNRWK